MSLENLFDFFKEAEGLPSGSIPLTKSGEDSLVSGIIPSDIVSEVEEMGPDYKAFLDVFLAVKGIDVFHNLDKKIQGVGGDISNTVRIYDLQKNLELEKFYKLLTRHPASTFYQMICRSSYKKNLPYVTEILEYLISFFLISERYEECAEIKKYIDFLQQKS